MRGSGARRGGATGRAPAQRGFTLIELMVALVVSSLLVGMILAIFVRMSTAYRGQQQIAEVQSKLAAARALIEYDAKHPGLGTAQGFRIMSTPAGEIHPPLQVTNSSSGPDRIRFFYADTSKRSHVGTAAGLCNKLQCDTLDSTDDFAVGDLVLSSVADMVTTLSPYNAAGDAHLTTFDTCVLQIASKGPTQLVFATSGLWGEPNNTNCPAPVPGQTVFYKFVAHAWRIDPSRRALGVLQLSTTGDLVGGNDWQDQAYGFTDIQVSTRFFEPGDLTDTPDPDLDAERDWYSDSVQETRTAQQLQTSFLTPIQISISLVARTERDVEGVASSSTPNLTVSGNSANNTIGDRAAVALPSASSSLSGNRIFRYTTFQVDLRNMGVGR